MTRVDFYILPEGKTALDYTARLVQKAFRRGHEIYVHTRDEAQSKAMSQALWERPDGFLAHGCNSEGSGHQRIQVSHQEHPGQHEDIMVNLAGTIPECFSRFGRVLEIVPAEPDARTQSRENFQFYRARGYALKTHNI